jgi:hypothetical protein
MHRNLIAWSAMVLGLVSILTVLSRAEVDASPVPVQPVIYVYAER